MKVKVSTELPDGTLNVFFLDITNPNQTQTLNIEYVSSHDGGPLMRPSKPPR